MNQDQRNVREFHLAMQKAGAASEPDPSTPTMPSRERRILRAKLMLEECLETIHEGLGLCFAVPEQAEDSMTIAHYLKKQDLPFIEIEEGDLVKLADGLADQKYVINGTALAAGIDMQPVDEEVHFSNMTKFVDGTFREDGKYVKGPAYTKPDIARVLSAQSA